MSACGLARGTAAGQGEEFPRFSEFWIERSQPGTTALKIFGLLDSPRLAGAYRFVLAPVRMLFHAQFVFAALTGWKLDGKSPPRDNAAVALGQPCASGPLAARASFC